jgi:hypothetical protein
LPCRVCQQQGFGVVEAGRRTRLRTMRWLILPSDRGGGFSPANFRRCGECGCFFPESMKACPWDGTVPGRRARSSVVWIPAEGRNVELDATSEADDDPQGSLSVPAADRDGDMLTRLIDLKNDMAKVPPRYRAELRALLESIFGGRVAIL